MQQSCTDIRCSSAHVLLSVYCGRLKTPQAHMSAEGLSGLSLLGLRQTRCSWALCAVELDRRKKQSCPGAAECLSCAAQDHTGRHDKRSRPCCPCWGGSTVGRIGAFNSGTCCSPLAHKAGGNLTQSFTVTAGQCHQGAASKQPAEHCLLPVDSRHQRAPDRARGRCRATAPQESKDLPHLSAS